MPEPAGLGANLGGTAGVGAGWEWVPVSTLVVGTVPGTLSTPGATRIPGKMPAVVADMSKFN